MRLVFCLLLPALAFAGNARYLDIKYLTDALADGDYDKFEGYMETMERKGFHSDPFVQIVVIESAIRRRNLVEVFEAVRDFDRSMGNFPDFDGRYREMILGLPTGDRERYFISDVGKARFPNLARLETFAISPLPSLADASEYDWVDFYNYFASELNQLAGGHIVDYKENDSLSRLSGVSWFKVKEISNRYLSGELEAVPQLDGVGLEARFELDILKVIQSYDRLGRIAPKEYAELSSFQRSTLNQVRALAHYGGSANYFSTAKSNLDTLLFDYMLDVEVMNQVLTGVAEAGEITEDESEQLFKELPHFLVSAVDDVLKWLEDGRNEWSSLIEIEYIYDYDDLELPAGMFRDKDEALVRLKFCKAKALAYGGSGAAALELMEEIINAAIFSRQNTTLSGSRTVLLKSLQQYYSFGISLAVEGDEPQLAFEWASRLKSPNMVDAALHGYAVNAGLSEPQNLRLDSAGFGSVGLAYRGMSVESAASRGILSVNYTISGVAEWSFRSIKSALRGRQLIEFAIVDGQIYCFLVNRKHVVVRKLGEASDLEPIVARFVKGLREGEQVMREAQHLRELLLGSFEGDLSEDELVIVCDGFLNRLPFDALGGEVHPRRRLITYLPSSGLISALQVKRLSFGDAMVWEAGESNLGFPKLDFAKEEAQFVKDAAIEANFISGVKLSETTLKNLVGDFDLLHFAGHVVFNEEQPLLSGLIINKDPESDGILTSYEIERAGWSADFVVLSGCESGKAGLVDGNEMHGLVRSFILRGAKGLIVSFWPVEDESTAKLMRKFYEYAATKNTPKEALNKAKLDLIAEYPDSPAKWASFYYIGI